MKNLQWRTKHFNQLSLTEFHNIIQLREAVFVVEQNCPYLDVDGQDLNAYLIYAQLEQKIIATSRILIGKEKNIIHIGRICTHEKYRNKSIGKLLVQYSIDFSLEELKAKTIIISAQTYLLKFYESFGFEPEGEEYLEDDIPHIKMVLNPLNYRSSQSEHNN